MRLPTPSAARSLAERLALARRVLRPYSETAPGLILARLEQEGRSGGGAAFRLLGRGRSSPDLPALHECARRYVAGGGAIELDRPARRFWIVVPAGRGWRLTEEVGRPEPGALRERRMPRLPFQRPVSLPPELGRVAANLARVRPGDQVVDPFVGTGALLMEAAVLGARVTGVDRDPTMVRGALANLATVEARVDRLNVADAGEAFPPPTGEGWDAVLTDPPYGRSSGSAGEEPVQLVGRVLPKWAPFVRPGGRIVVVLPGGPDPLPPPWRREVGVADRVHRSLTREFRVYTRPPELPTMR